MLYNLEKYSAYKFNEVFARLAKDSTQFMAYFREEVAIGVNGTKVHTFMAGLLNEVDWEKAMSFSHFLKIFYDATIKLSATKTPTSHLVLKTFVNFKLEIDEKINDVSDHILQKCGYYNKT